MFGLRFPITTAEHTRSYYAATAPGRKRAPLGADIEADVLVVGGGFSGVNTALELAERGVDVVLLEGHRIGWGASGRNGGQVIGGLGHDPERFRRRIGAAGVRLVHELGVECVDILRERVARHAIDCDLRWGYCDVALKPRHLRWLQQEQRDQSARNYPHELVLLGRDELRDFVGSDAYVGGLYNPGGAGQVNPLKLCQGEAEAAEAAGARLFEMSRVERIEHGATPTAYTAQGSVRARHLVLCANAHLDNLEPRIAARMIPASTCIIATEPLAPGLAREILPRDVAVCDQRTALDYFRLSADRRLLFGGLCNYTGLVQENYVRIMRRKMLAIFPQLDATGIEFAWDGQMAIGMNRMPQVGRLAPNSYYIQAFSGHGVAPTHIMARLVAEAICAESRRFDVISAIPHRAFPGGRYLRRPAMALGMLYFKALDYL
ncbi:MAG: FAD-dependent oxidoreductase [Halioglobus sp.]|nr:FAD-dependent oxidoreductase [Halioglobus sp.]